MIKYSLGKCKTKAAHYAKLLNHKKLDLKKIKKKYEVVLETPILLVIKINNTEIVVHGYGELLFKKCKDIEWMDKTAQEIYEVGLGK